MKTLLILMATLIFSGASAMAAQQINHNRMNYLVNRVHNCSILPYTLNHQNQKVYHAISSHCPEVKVVDRGTAKVRVAGHVFEIRMEESSISDGDFYDVYFTDLTNGETERVEAVLAFGDVLLGILGGRTQGIPETYVRDTNLVSDLDRNLMTYAY